MSKACNICGFKENPLDALFCGACGSKLPKTIDTEKAKGISKIITSVLNHARGKEGRSIIGRNAPCPCGSGKKIQKLSWTLTLVSGICGFFGYLKLKSE